jgi:hypothetical protein
VRPNEKGPGDCPPARSHLTYLHYVPTALGTTRPASAGIPARTAEAEEAAAAGPCRTPEGTPGTDHRNTLA